MRWPRLVPEGPESGRASTPAAVLPSRPRERVQAAVGEPNASWGRLPEFSLLAAVGLLIVAAGDAAAWHGARWGTALFWLGLAVVVAPFAARLLSAAPARRERVGLVVLLGMGLYLVKIFHSPLYFSDIDELGHWRTVSDILRSNHLFHENPLLTVSPYYPGLEMVTAAVARVTGLGVYPAGLLVVGCAKLMLVIALFLLAERLSASARVAGIACLIYCANPNFVFFDSNFSYESLALPLAVLTLLLVARFVAEDGPVRIGHALVIGVLIGAVTVTHHMTSYALLAFFALWAAVASVRAEPHRGRTAAKRLGVLTLFTLCLVAVWTDLVASLAISYLQPVLSSAVLSFLKLVFRDEGSRQLFRSRSGYVAAAWEHWAAYASVGLVLLSLPLGIVAVWHRHRRRAALLALSLAVLAYPLTLGLRLTPSGAETSNRASEFLFIAICLVAAVGLVEYHSRRLPVRALWLGLPLCAVVLVTGGIIIGTPPWSRLPGPYLVGADDRSVDSEGIAAAAWMRDTLGPDNRVASDRIGTLLAGSYGEQRAVTGLIDRIPTELIALFASPTFGQDQLDTITRGRIQYVEFDRRITQSLPRAIYFDDDPPRSEPISAAAMAKFDNNAGISRLYDSGNIVLYNTGELHAGP